MLALGSTDTVLEILEEVFQERERRTATVVPDHEINSQLVVLPGFGKGRVGGGPKRDIVGNDDAIQALGENRTDVLKRDRRVP